MRLCQFFCCGGKVNFVQNTLQSRSFLKNIANFPCKKMIPYKSYIQEDQLFLALYGSTTIQSRLFLKNIENFVWYPYQYLLGFFILEKQHANIPDRGFLFLCNTLLLYSLCHYSQMEWLMERFPKKWLLLRISFLFSIDQQLYSHDRFSKISTTFCVSRNWWIIVVFL